MDISFTKTLSFKDVCEKSHCLTMLDYYDAVDTAMDEDTNAERSPSAIRN